MKKSALLLIPCCLLALAACQPSNKNKMPNKELMEQLLQEKIDSLAIILEETININNLTDEEKADYAFWLTKTHVKQYRSLMNDTLIHYAVEYYKKTESPYFFDASLLAAEQINWSGTALSKQEQLLNETMQIAIQQKDTATVQRICSQLTGLYVMPAYSEKIRDLIRITKEYAGINPNLVTNVNLMRQFELLSLHDSVFFYLQKGLELAREQNNTWDEYQLTRTYSNLLSISGKGKEALSVLRDLENKMPAGNELRYNYLAIWMNLGRLDSAQANINSFNSLIEEIKSLESQVDGLDIEINLNKLILELLQKVVHAKEGKLFTMAEIGPTANNLLWKIRNRIKISREQQFVQSKLIRHNLMLEIEKGKMKQRLLWAGIVVLLGVILIVFVYQRKLLKKERSFQKAKEQLRLHTLQLSENEAIIRKNEELIVSLSSQLDENDDLKQEISQLYEDNEALIERNILLQKDIEQNSKFMDQKDTDFEMYERLAEQNVRLQERERFLTARLIAHTEILDKLSRKPRYIDKSQWYEIIDAVNQLFEGYSYRLHSNFPTLTEEDIFYCCLFKLRLSTTIVGILMGISPSSVTKRKQRIKEKMNQQVSTENRSEQLLEIYYWN